MNNEPSGFPIIRLIDAGLLTTVQDLGRLGFQKYGVSVGGAMDTLALRAANRLVGNKEDEAALEITMAGIRIQALDRCLIAVAGAQFALRVNERPMPMDTALYLRPDEEFDFGERMSGARAYLALAGGVEVPPVLNSRSTDVRGSFGGSSGRALRSGDVIQIRSHEFRIERAGRMLPELIRAYYESGAPLRVIWGPHSEYFPDPERDTFLTGEFVLSELSDRMALRLRGERVAREDKELLSCGVTWGAIQVPPDGQPIILMADHQTTGGYPVLATVIRADIPRLAQKTAGERISFRAVTVAEAGRAREEIERLLASIRSD